MSPCVSVGLEGPNLLAVCPWCLHARRQSPTLYELEPDDKRLLLPGSGLAELGMGFQAGDPECTVPIFPQHCAEETLRSWFCPLNVAHSYLWKLCNLSEISQS